VLAGIIRYGQKRQEFRADLDTLQTAHGMMGAYIGVLIYQNLFRATVTYDPVIAALDKLMIAGFTPPKE
jgi:hypothetical protein